MLEARQLSFRYHATRPWIFENVNIRIAPGEIVGLRGESGHGKTTLAKALSGYLTPTGGKVLFHGAPLPRRGYQPVQLIFQHPELAINPRWKAQKALLETGMPPASLLEALSIDATWLNRYPHELSGGELQRLAVARTLNPRTRFLITDEMTSMLDANTQAQIWHCVLDFARQHDVGLLIVSHDAPLLQRLCHRIEAL